MMDIFLCLRIVLNFFELLSFLAGIYYWKKIAGSYWRFFPFYLGVIFLIEVGGEYAGYKLRWVSFNAALYSYFAIPLQFFFFYWLFWKYFHHTAAQKIPVVGAMVYLICWLIDISNLTGIRAAFVSFSYMAGNVVLLTLVIVFLLRFMRSEEILAYKQSMMFWTATGLLIFYLLSLPLYGLWNTLANKYGALFNHYWVATMIFDCMMYILFTLAFVWGKPK